METNALADANDYSGWTEEALLKRSQAALEAPDFRYIPRGRQKAIDAGIIRLFDRLSMTSAIPSTTFFITLHNDI